MLNIIRSQSKILFAALLVVIGLSFIVFFNRTSLNDLRDAQRWSIQGKPVTMDEYRIQSQNTRLLLTLSGGGRTQGRDMDQTITRQTWNRLLLMNEADRIDVRVADIEVIDFIKNLPFLQKDKKFDQALYDQFTENFLRSQGISAQRFEQIVRDELRVAAVQKALTANAVGTPSEVKELFDRYYSPVKFLTVTFELSKFTPKQVPADADIEKEFKAQASNPAYRSPEKRKIEYAIFRLKPEQAKLAEKEKAAAKQALGEKAVQLTLKLADDKKAGFLTTAAAFQAEAGATGFFAATDAPKPFATGSQALSMAFRLSPEDPISNVVDIEDGYAVINLREIQASQPLPLAAVREALIRRLNDQQAQISLRQEAEKAAQQIAEAVKAGSTFKDAAAKLKLAVREVPEFVPAESNFKDQSDYALLPLTQSLKTHEVGSFSSSATGGFIPWIEERKQASTAAFDKAKGNLEQHLASQRRQQIFGDWIRLQYKNPKNSLPEHLEAPAGLDIE